MTDISCTFAGDREQTLIAYLYDDIEAAERAAFATHLAGCNRCQRELAALGGVRQRLARWQPPRAGTLEPQTAGVESPPADPSAERAAPAPWYREVPAWAQVAAALLFLGAAAGIANIEIRSDSNGVTVRTGWSKAATPSAPAVQAAAAADVPSRAELTAAEERLRGEIRQLGAASPVRTTDPETLRRIRALIDESEKREQRELALRVAQVLHDVSTQRQADLSKIDRNLGLIQNSTGVEILKQREMVNYLMRVSQRQ